MAKKYASTTACTDTTNSRNAVDCRDAVDYTNTTDCSDTVDSNAVDCGNCGSGCGCKSKKK